MDIHYQGQITRDDLTKFLKLAYVNRLWFLYLFGPLFTLCAAMFIVKLIQGPFDTIWPMVTIYMGLMATYPWWWSSLTARKTYQDQPEFRGVISGAINDEEITILTANTTATSKWITYKKNCP
jgi:hypothetical protein